MIVGRRGVLRVGSPDWKTIAQIVRIGLPTAVTGVVFSLIYVAVTRTATQFETGGVPGRGSGIEPMPADDPSAAVVSPGG